VLDHELAYLALRQRLATVVVATTGTMTLTATAAGYTRSSGSFLTDGFAAGQEVTPSGFTQTDVGVVTHVDESTLTIAGGRQAQSAGAGRSLSVQLPAVRVWENATTKPVAGRPYVEADYVPATAQLLTAPAVGGIVEETGLFVVRWFGVGNVGFLDLNRAASAVLELFRPGQTLALADGSALRWRENPGPFRGQVRPDGAGWSLVVITIPWRLYTLN
jgi:hypothetical protein